jgi:hypothetical protein
MRGIKASVLGYLESLRFPWLLLITVILFLLNLLIPDVLPFVDEILLALVAALLARFKRKKPLQ